MKTLLYKKEKSMKKLFVISALLVSLIACDKEEEKAPAADVASDVAPDVVAGDSSASVDVSVDATPVETPDTSSSTDASVGG